MATQQKNKPLIIRTEVKGTPFTFVKMASKQWFIVMGKYRINQDPLETEEHCNEYLKENMWLVIAQLCGIISDFQIQETLKIKQNGNN